MASFILKHVYCGYLRHYLLIALLILLIHALCTDSTGDNKNGLDDNGSKAESKVPYSKKLEHSATTKRRRTKITKTTLASLVSQKIQPDKGLKPSPTKEFKDTNLNSHLGPIGNTKIDRKKQDTNEIAKKEQDLTDKSKQLKTEKAGNVEGGENTKGVKSDKHSADDPSSSSGFMTYFIIIAVVVIIGYLIYHNKNKLMGYIVEGRNSSHGRRRRIQTTNDYKPLNNDDDDVSRRIENA